MSVNLSAVQVANRGLAETVAAALRISGLDPSCLALELTESMLVSDNEELSETLVALKALGVRLVLDDFGTGYSSLSYLTRLPLDALKVDRSFVDGLGTEPRDTAVTEAIVAMSRALSLRVVGEGAETELQVAELARLGCDLVQGFHFSRPVPGRGDHADARRGPGLAPRPREALGASARSLVGGRPRLQRRDGGGAALRGAVGDLHLAAWPYRWVRSPAGRRRCRSRCSSRRRGYAQAEGRGLARLERERLRAAGGRRSHRWCAAGVVGSAAPSCGQELDPGVAARGAGAEPVFLRAKPSSPWPVAPWPPRKERLRSAAVHWLAEPLSIAAPPLLAVAVPV